MTDTARTPMNLTDISKTRKPGADMPVGGSCGCCEPRQTIKAPPASADAVIAHYPVTGLTCGSCAGRVSNAIKTLDAVQDVQITLVPGGTSTVSVTSTQPIAHASLQDAVEKSGYQLTTA